MPGEEVALALGAASFFKWLMSNGANKDATDAQMGALKDAQGAIQGGADKALSYQQPYLQNAGQDYGRLRGLVQNGYFQQPYNKSFTAETNRPAGFSFDPSKGNASFAPWKPQQGPASFTPQGLPSMNGYLPPPTPQQAPQSSAPGQMSAPKPDINQILQAALKNMPQNMPPNPTPIGPPGGFGGANGGGGGLLNYNPQTGQGKPPVTQGGSLPDPTKPSMAQYYQLITKYPWLKGGSGPLEGGMPGNGIPRGGLL